MLPKHVKMDINKDMTPHTWMGKQPQQNVPNDTYKHIVHSPVTHLPHLPYLFPRLFGGASCYTYHTYPTSLALAYPTRSQPILFTLLTLLHRPFWGIL